MRLSVNSFDWPSTSTPLAVRTIIRACDVAVPLAGQIHDEPV